MASVGKSFNFLIVLAVLLALFVIVLMNRYISATKRDAREQARLEFGKVEKVDMAKVLVSKIEIQGGMAVTSDMVEVKEIPVKFVPSGALKSPDEVNGRLAAHFIAPEEMIMDTKLRTKERLNKASMMIEKGKRLVSVSVNDLKSASYLVKTGDRVDLIGTFTVPGGTTGPTGELTDASLTTVFMQKVKIFDIVYGNETSTEQESKKKGKESGGVPRLARGTTATFEVSPKEAEIILAAERQGAPIAMALRRYDDEEIIQPQGTLSTEPFKGFMPEPEAPPEIEAPPPPPTRKKVF